MLARGDTARGLGRLRVLVLIAHWTCRSKNWSAVRTVYESIIDEIEQGESDWSDDFSGHETILPSMQNYNQVSNEKTGGHKGEDKKRGGNIEVYWCKNYQSGNCEQTSPHMAQIRPDEPMVPVVHMCASCWNAGRKRKEHPEGDPACPTKK